MHFAHGSLGNRDIFMSMKRNLKFQKKHAIPMESTKYHTMKNIKKILKNNQTADNISQICCPHVELIPCALKSWEEDTAL